MAKAKPAPAFNPTTTYITIDGNAATAIPVTESFWPEVMAGTREIGGWLMTAFPQAEDWATWERHPKGEEILIIGSPRGLEGSLTRGLVSQLRTVENIPLLQIDAAVNPGNSGSPVFDRTGRVIGIVFLGGDKAMGVAGINFAISAEAIRSALASDQRLAAETGVARLVAAR